MHDVIIFFSSFFSSLWVTFHSAPRGHESSAKVTGLDPAQSFTAFLEVFCGRVSDFTVYGSPLGERTAIPKPQVYPFPAAFGIFSHSSNATYREEQKQAYMSCPTKASTTFST